MPTKEPFQYALEPREMEPGMRWLALSLRNIGSQNLTALDVKLNSLDAYSIGVGGTGSYVALLEPQEEKTRAFQISANITTQVYASVDGYRDGRPFHWESPALRIQVGRDVAELLSMFAITEPYPPAGERIRCEATLYGLQPNEGLNLEFWIDTPDGGIEELARMATQQMAAGEQATYSVEFTPEEEGTYTVHAYLYDGVRRIGHETDVVYVVKG